MSDEHLDGKRIQHLLNVVRSTTASKASDSKALKTLAQSGAAKVVITDDAPSHDDVLTKASDVSRAGVVTNETGENINHVNIRKVELIYRFFKVTYQSKFTSSIKTQEDISDWKRIWGIVVQQFDEEHITSCLHAVVKSFYWPPNPIEFAEFCKIRLSGLQMPCAEFAYAEACNNSARPSGSEWSHPVVYWTGKNVGWYSLRMQDKASVFPLFSSTYERIKADYINDRLPPIPHKNALNALNKECINAETQINSVMRDGVEEIVRIVRMNPSIAENEINRLFYFLMLPKGVVRDRLMARSRQEIEVKGIKCSKEVFS